jgi:hypothetical protein
MEEKFVWGSEGSVMFWAKHYGGWSLWSRRLVTSCHRQESEMDEEI